MNRIKHVLMTADTIGGVWNYALELSRVLGKFDVTVSLATMGSRIAPQQRAEARKISNLTLYESSFKLEWMPEPWDDVQRAGEWLLELESKLQPDVVHLNGYCHGALNWKSPTVIVCHSCVLSWWQAVKYEEAPFEWMCYEDEVRHGLMRADGVVAPTEAMLRSIIQTYGEVANGKVIYNARDAKQFRPGKKENIVLTVGRLWDEAKNIAAVDAVAKELPWPVYAAGEAQCPVNGSHSNANLKGLGKLSTEEVADWYSRASIYAHPARYEPFGLTALEAALSGCALVLGDIETLREIWDGCALFVDPENPGALKEAIMSLIEDRELRERMASKAMGRAKLFNPQRMGCEYLELYEELVLERAASPRGKARVL